MIISASRVGSACVLGSALSDAEIADRDQRFPELRRVAEVPCKFERLAKLRVGGRKLAMREKRLSAQAARLDDVLLALARHSRAQSFVGVRRCGSDLAACQSQLAEAVEQVLPIPPEHPPILRPRVAHDPLDRSVVLVRPGQAAQRY